MSARFERQEASCIENHHTYINKVTADVKELKEFLTQLASKDNTIGQVILDTIVRAHSSEYPIPAIGHIGWSSILLCISNLDDTFTVVFHGEGKYIACIMQENEYSELMGDILSKLEED